MSRDYMRKWLKTEKGQEYQKRKNEKRRLEKRDPEKNRAEKLKYLYGITIEKYEEILSHQGGVCAICGKPPKKKRLQVDHNHETGEVRGILCWSCNYGLGYFKDSLEYLESAIKYLRRG